jgi:hypothetical protein
MNIKSRRQTAIRQQARVIVVAELFITVLRTSVAQRRAEQEYPFPKDSGI